MGTRGLMGFRLDSQDKATYNHFDSYPDCLGRNMVNFIKNNYATNADRLNVERMVRELRMVGREDKPTEADKLKLKTLGLFDGSVSSRTDDEWYTLLRNAQGRPLVALQAGVMEDQRAFAYDSLFCEYAYIVNFDDGVLEVYAGFQKKPGKGRFADEVAADPSLKDSSGYYPVTLADRIPFHEIASGDEDALVVRMEKACGHDREEGRAA